MNIDIDATATAIAEPANKTFVVWFDRNDDPYFTFYRNDAYGDDERWWNADLYDTGDEDGPKSWDDLCAEAEGMRGPVQLVPATEVEQLLAELDRVRADLTAALDERDEARIHRDQLAVDNQASADNNDQLRADLAAAHNHAHRQDTEIQRLTRDGIAYANENAELKRQLGSFEALLNQTQDRLAEANRAAAVDALLAQTEAGVAR